MYFVFNFVALNYFKSSIEILKLHVFLQSSKQLPLTFQNFKYNTYLFILFHRGF